MEPLKSHRNGAKTVANAQKCRILVVDDEKNIRRVLCKMLSKLGYQAHEAGSGEEALQRLSGSPPFHCVLSDLNMPGMDGWEMARQIRSLFPSMPIVAIITGISPVEVLPRMAGSGIEHALFKPLDLDQLRESMEYILGRACKGPPPETHWAA
jgi:CheY-like chemotaxis protein